VSCAASDVIPSLHSNSALFCRLLPLLQPTSVCTLALVWMLQLHLLLLLGAGDLRHTGWVFYAMSLPVNVIVIVVINMFFVLLSHLHCSITAIHHCQLSSCC
jgi:hypothetical protein